jgi:hypothetical protein
VCGWSFSTLTKQNLKKRASGTAANPAKLPEMCFLAAYTYTLLRHGHGFDLHRNLTCADKVELDGVKLNIGWPLGAMLYEINTLPWEYSPETAHQVASHSKSRDRQHSPKRRKGSGKGHDSSSPRRDLDDLDAEVVRRQGTEPKQGAGEGIGVLESWSGYQGASIWLSLGATLGLVVGLFTAKYLGLGGTTGLIVSFDDAATRPLTQLANNAPPIHGGLKNVASSVHSRQPLLGRQQRGPPGSSYGTLHE